MTIPNIRITIVIIIIIGCIPKSALLQQHVQYFITTGDYSFEAVIGYDQYGYGSLWIQFEEPIWFPTMSIEGYFYQSVGYLPRFQCHPYLLCVRTLTIRDEFVSPIGFLCWLHLQHGRLIVDLSIRLLLVIGVHHILHCNETNNRVGTAKRRRYWQRCQPTDNAKMKRQPQNYSSIDSTNSRDSCRLHGQWVYRWWFVDRHG